MIGIRNVNCFDGARIIEHASVAVSGTSVAGVWAGGDALPACDTVIDGEGRLLVPGYIDLHLHGCAGCDVMDGTAESLRTIAETLAQNGTTSFLPTTVTMPKQATAKAMAAVRAYGNPATGAEVLGVHLEGPFINVRHKGAQNERYILEPSVPAFLDFVDGDLSGIRRVTLAPEIGEGIGLTRYLAQRGVCVSAGHTCASAEAFHASEKAGLKLCTHLYNGMEPMHHRTPGTVGAALASDEAYVEVIADLNHVAPDVLRLTAKAKDAGHCILITDSLSATGLGDGEYSLGGQKVTVQNGTARVESGSLAGSVIFLWQAVKNMAERVHVNLVSALRMATVNPARVIGVENRKGAVRPGFDADLNLLRDDLSVAFTMVRGRVVKA